MVLLYLIWNLRVCKERKGWIVYSQEGVMAQISHYVPA